MWFSQADWEILQRLQELALELPWTTFLVAVFSMVSIEPWTRWFLRHTGLEILPFVEYTWTGRGPLGLWHSYQWQLSLLIVRASYCGSVKTLKQWSMPVNTQSRWYPPFTSWISVISRQNSWLLCEAQIQFWLHRWWPHHYIHSFASTL